MPGSPGDKCRFALDRDIHFTEVVVVEFLFELDAFDVSLLFFFLTIVSRLKIYRDFSLPRQRAGVA